MGGNSHVDAWKQARGGRSAWKPLQEALLKTAADQSAPRVPKQAQASVTADCGSAFLCLETGAVGSLQHFTRCCKSDGSHKLLMDLERQELYATACGDYVYDSDFDEAIMAVKATLLKKRSSVALVAAPSAGAAKSLAPMTPRSKAGFKRIKLPNSWVHYSDSPQALLEGARPVVAADGLPMGLRGFNNLGNTCFMSSVLQAMLHAPLLRTFFLGAGHPRELCPLREERGYCLSCELDRIFGEQYSGNRKPFSPVDLLHAWWTHADHLAGYQQHDAHEFYLNILCAMDGATGGVRGMLRKHMKQEALSPQPSATAGDGSADDKSSGDESIAESVFGGILRSDVTCQGCGYTSTAYDPFLDISLTLHNWNAPRAHPKPAVSASAPPSGGSGAVDSGMESGGVTETQVVSQKRPRGRPRLHPRPAATPPASSATVATAPATRAASPMAAPELPSDPGEETWRLGSPAEPSKEGGTPEDATSDADAASSIAGGQSPRGGSLSRRDSSESIIGPCSSPPSDKRKPGRPRRCGTCYHCLNRHLKKACIANLQERQVSDGTQQPQRGLPPTGIADVPGRPPVGAKGATLVGGDFPGADGMAESLIGCLYAYMRTEKLGATDRWVCGCCGQVQQATKQMSIRRLPPVLCLHIKRFEHHGHRKGSRKVDTPLIFPVQQCLDMTPFTASSVLRKRFSDRTGNMPSSLDGTSNRNDAQYELYAVISHRGKMDGGHYVTFLKVDGLWYQCDDSWIVPVEVDTVKKCQAYMLYYKRKENSSQS